MENSSRLDKLFVALPSVVFELAADDIVGLVSLQAESFAEFLEKEKENGGCENADYREKI